MGEDGQGGGFEAGGGGLISMSAVAHILSERNKCGASGVAFLAVAIWAAYRLTTDQAFTYGWCLDVTMLVCCAVAFVQSGFRAINADKKLLDLSSQAQPSSAEDRLDELERLKRRDMVTAEEYAAKRLEILKSL